MSVAVVIPCHNAVEWLAATLDSVLRQTCRPDEIVVADDGSSDGSLAIAEGYADRGVRVVRGPFGGAGAARTAGLAATVADSLMFLDADDLLGLDVLEHLLRALPVGGVVHCDWQRYRLVADAAWIAAPASCAPRAPWQDDLSAWLTGWYCPPCAILWEREALLRAGGWSTSATNPNDDGELMMRALTAGVPLARAAGGVAYYRSLPRGGSLSAGSFTPAGLRDRLGVLDGVRDRLADTQRLGPYRLSLSEAYALVARDARRIGDEDAVARCEAARRGLGVAAPLQRVSSLVRRRAAYLVKRRPPRRVRALSTPTPADAGEDAREALVSVVIPTYRRPDASVRAARSALAQTHSRVEVIVVDDASGDGTADAVDAIGDPRLRVVRRTVNGGVARTRNAGMAAARGAFIAFLDSDDEWLPEKLERQLAVFAAGGVGLGLVHCGAETLNPDGTRSCRKTDLVPDPFARLLCRNLVDGGGSGAVIRREVFRAIGGFDPSLPAIEDWDYWIRASRLFLLGASPEILVRYDDQDAPGRRSRAFDANQTGRRMLAGRYDEDLRWAGAKQAFLMETARRDLTDAHGRGGRGRLHVLEALAAGPSNPRLYVWLPYMLAPARLRAWLRRLDERDEPRVV